MTRSTSTLLRRRHSSPSAEGHCSQEQRKGEERRGEAEREGGGDKREREKGEERGGERRERAEGEREEGIDR